MTSVICEEFNLAPDVADRQDIALCKRIMVLRRYRDAWVEVEAGVEQAKLTPGPGLEHVLDVHVARAKGEID